MVRYGAKSFRVADTVYNVQYRRLLFCVKMRSFLYSSCSSVFHSIFCIGANDGTILKVSASSKKTFHKVSEINAIFQPFCNFSVPLCF